MPNNFFMPSGLPSDVQQQLLNAAKTRQPSYSQIGTANPQSLPNFEEPVARATSDILSSKKLSDKEKIKLLKKLNILSSPLTPLGQY